LPPVGGRESTTQSANAFLYNTIQLYEKMMRIFFLGHFDASPFDVFVERQNQKSKEQETNMRKVVVSESIALDGVFDAETMGQWAAPHFSEERDEFIRGIVLGADALLLGRRTYDIQAWYWPNQKNDKYGIANHKNKMEKYVVTSTPLQAQWNNSTIISVDEVASLKEQPGRKILIEGSATLVEALAQAGLIDEYKLLVHPSLAGSGKRFFKEGRGLTRLQLIESKPLNLGVIALSYKPAQS
jgi:dihydrofolate reductase